MADLNNIRGSHEDDTLYGTEGGDFIYGGADRTDDTLYGRGGHDSLFGGHGDDTLDGGHGNDWLQGDWPSERGDDTFVFRLGDGFDFLRDLDGDDTIEFLWGDEDAGRFRFIERDGKAVIIYGDGGTDDGAIHTYYSGNSYSPAKTAGGTGGGTVMLDEWSLAQLKASGIGFMISGGAGDNMLHGAFGRDTVYGGKGDDTIKGHRGNDWLYGEDGDDAIWGKKGDDVLFGGAGSDVLGGGKGDDILWGDVGDDTLRGGLGGDRFAFRKGDGDDTIRDFGDGDTILLVDVGHGFAGLMIADDGVGNAVISYGDAGDTVTLLDVEAASLTADDCLFV